MADSKVSALTALTGANVASDDKFVVVDTSATASKRIDASELNSYVLNQVPGLTALTGSGVASDDKLLIADTSASAAKRIDASELNSYVLNQVSGLTALTGANVATDDQLLISDTSATASKRIDISELLTYLQTRGMPRVTRLGTQHASSSTTGTEITDLQQTLEAGTYTFEYSLIVRSATATVGPMVGVNFTGTAAVKTMIAWWADASGSLLAETHNMDDQGILSSGFISGMANKAYSTTAPNMGTTVGVATTASDTPMFIKGILIVTASGDLECWHSSETATATSVEVGSSLVVVRTA